jgi:large repetitive protein
MKTHLQTIILLALLIIATPSAIAQQASNFNDSGFDIGFGFGASYQGSDLRNFSGGGATLFLGHSIYQKEQSFFSLDWRLRFLAGQNTAFDDRITIGNNYENIQYTHFNYDLELVLTLNRLRENTGIVISGFAGAGITHNITYQDLLKDGVPYDYSVINSDGNDRRFEINQDLKELSDNNFETAGINHGCFSPSLGFFVGYQFGPRFTMGIEHKTNYFIDETNTLSGANIDGKIVPDSKIDRNHYTALLLKWDIGYAKPPTPPCLQPVVNFNVSEINSNNISHVLNGTITNVGQNDNIAISVDGNPDPYFFIDFATGQIKSQYNFAPGNHTVSISVSTRCGNDEKTIQIFVKEPCYGPEIDFSVNEMHKKDFTHSLSGTISNLNSKNEITLYVNDIIQQNFSYSPDNFKINAELKLIPGKNIISIKAQNSCGTDLETLEVNVGQPCIPPVVDFSITEVTLLNYSHSLHGKILNINELSSIQILVNGKNETNFE